MDMKAYNEVKEMMGDILQDLISTFLDFMPEQLRSLEQAVNENDSEQIFAIAHRIKSSSGSIGALGLAQHAEKLELQGKKGIHEGNTALFANLVEGYEDVAEFLKQEKT